MIVTGKGSWFSLRLSPWYVNYAPGVSPTLNNIWATTNWTPWAEERGEGGGDKVVWVRGAYGFQKTSRGV